MFFWKPEMSKCSCDWKKVKVWTLKVVWSLRSSLFVIGPGTSFLSCEISVESSRNIPIHLLKSVFIPVCNIAVFKKYTLPHIVIVMMTSYVLSLH